MTDEEKQRRLDISSDLSSNMDVFVRMITGYGTWYFQYNSGKNGIRAYNGKQKVRQNRKKSFFFHHFEFTKQGQAMNQHCY